MAALHRHQLVRLGDAGWRTVRDRAWDATARECLDHWAAHRLPLVVTRQVPEADPDVVALGLPAPGRWGRRRLALSVRRADVSFVDAFPPVDALTARLPRAARPAWRSLCADLQALGARARVYGSRGWQLLTGLDHVRAGSDIDLWIAAADVSQADAVAARLHAWPDGLPRLDGELVFDDDDAVAWREWQAWRGGGAGSVLVKSLAGSRLVAARDHGRLGDSAAPGVGGPIVGRSAQPDRVREDAP